MLSLIFYISVQKQPASNRYSKLYVGGHILRIQLITNTRFINKNGAVMCFAASSIPLRCKNNYVMGWTLTALRKRFFFSIELCMMQFPHVLHLLLGHKIRQLFT